MNQNNMVIRKAHHSEAPRIILISRFEIEYNFEALSSEQSIKNAINNKNYEVIVASINGIIEGFAKMRFQHKESHLMLLGVEPKNRRKGIGKALLSSLEDLCKKKTIKKIKLEVRESNKIAKIFYESLGYQKTKIVNKFYINDENSIMMEKLL